MYLVLSGTVDVIGMTTARVGRLRSGRRHGAGRSGRSRILRTADVRAVTKVEALRFDYERMRSDLRYFPALSLH